MNPFNIHISISSYAILSPHRAYFQLTDDTKSHNICVFVDGCYVFVYGDQIQQCAFHVEGSDWFDTIQGLGESCQVADTPGKVGSLIVKRLSEKLTELRNDDKLFTVADGESLRLGSSETTDHIKLVSGYRSKGNWLPHATLRDGKWLLHCELEDAQAVVGFLNSKETP